MEEIKIYGADDIKIKDDFTEPYLTKAYLMSILHRIEDDIKKYVKLSDIEKFIETYIKAYGEFKAPECDFYLEPIEDIGKYRFKEFTINKINLYSSLKGYVVAGLDASYHHPRGHFLIDFILYNIGYYYEKLGFREGGSGYKPFLILIASNEVDIDLETKDLEFKFLSHLVEHIKKRFGDRVYVLLDESLNLAYTHGWRIDRRREYASLYKKTMEMLIDEAVYPIGIFYTRARDVASSIKCMSKDRFMNIQDKHLFNKYLDVGERSQVFRVVSRVLSDVSFEVYTFYLKINEMNVIRVEFPSKLYHKYGSEAIDQIHRLILYDSLRNNGYSYILARSHEAALLRSEDRYNIERMIADMFKLPSKYVYSAKELFKRRPIA